MRENFLLIEKKLMLYMFTTKEINSVKKIINLFPYFQFAAKFLSFSFTMNYLPFSLTIS